MCLAILTEKGQAMSEHKHKLCGSRIAWLFFFTGFIYFTATATLHGITLYKQYKQVRLMTDMQNAIRMQMEYYERHAPIDPEQVL